MYEDPPEQETFYEEPPVVGSLQQGRGCAGLCPETASSATPARLTAYGCLKFGAACALICVASATVWEVLGGEYHGDPHPHMPCPPPKPDVSSGLGRGLGNRDPRLLSCP